MFRLLVGIDAKSGGYRHQPMNRLTAPSSTQGMRGFIGSCGVNLRQRMDVRALPDATLRTVTFRVGSLTCLAPP